MNIKNEYLKKTICDDIVLSVGGVGCILIN